MVALDHPVNPINAITGSIAGLALNLLNCKVKAIQIAVFPWFIPRNTYVKIEPILNL